MGGKTSKLARQKLPQRTWGSLAEEILCRDTQEGSRSSQEGVKTRVKDTLSRAFGPLCPAPFFLCFTAFLPQE